MATGWCKTRSPRCRAAFFYSLLRLPKRTRSLWRSSALRRNLFNWITVRALRNRSTKKKNGLFAHETLLVYHQEATKVESSYFSYCGIAVPETTNPCVPHSSPYSNVFVAHSALTLYWRTLGSSIAPVSQSGKSDRPPDSFSIKRVALKYMEGSIYLAGM